MTKTFSHEALFGFSNFGHWNLFNICDLVFVIFETSNIATGGGPRHLDNLSIELSSKPAY